MSDESTERAATDAPYDAVAELYDRAFTDITVRRDEWRWLQSRLDTAALRAQPPRVLDLGCGNGALLVKLAVRIRSGVGVDVSRRFIALAQRNARDLPQLSFQAIDSAQLPFADASFDVVISFLSFRYLDWPAIVPEIRRVLARGGRFLMVDMVQKRLALREAPRLVRSALQHIARPVRDPDFHRAVQALTSHPAWHAMLARHPMRHADEYSAFLQREFPGRVVHTLNVTPSKRVIAFDSGALSP